MPVGYQPSLSQLLVAGAWLPVADSNWPELPEKYILIALKSDGGGSTEIRRNPRAAFPGARMAAVAKRPNQSDPIAGGPNR